MQWVISWWNKLSEDFALSQKDYRFGIYLAKVIQGSDSSGHSDINAEDIGNIHENFPLNDEWNGI